MRGNMFVYVALLGYIPFVVGLFVLFPSRRAAIYGFLVAWLLLPMASISLHPFTDYNKMSAACFGILLSTVIFDPDKILGFRPSVWDLPMLVWCICPFISSVCNDLGAYDGFTAIVYQVTFWGMPYFIGRIYFTDLSTMRELAIALVVGGLIYVPLCWYEIRFSPQLHYKIYGFYQWEFGQSKRYGGYRPTVFMQTGLAVAMWMSTTAIVAFWLWWSKTIKKVVGIPMGFAAFILFVTAVACHSVGAAFLLMVGMGVLVMTRWTRSPVWVLGLALLPSVYMVLRADNLWTADNFVKLVGSNDNRSALSLNVRIKSERLLVDRALEQPVFGWGGWNRFRAVDEHGEMIGVPDQMWVIALGHFGLVGLISMTLLITGPMIVLAWKIPVRYWQHPGAAPAAAMAILLGLHMCDLLFNAMINPIFILCAGALSGMTFSLRGAASQRRLPAQSRAGALAPA